MAGARTCSTRVFREITDNAGTMTTKQAHGDESSASYLEQAGSLSRISVPGPPVALRLAMAHL